MIQALIDQIKASGKLTRIEIQGERIFIQIGETTYQGFNGNFEHYLFQAVIHALADALAKEKK